MKIGSIDLSQQVLIIAEAGNCHEGDVGRAKEMIHQADAAGADAIKFQTIVPERLVSADQTERLIQLRQRQLTYDQFRELAQTAAETGIMFLSTPLDVESALFLRQLVPAFKIASGDITFIPLLQTVASVGKPVLLSTGGSTLAQVAHSLEYLPGVPVCVLHCVIGYPTPLTQVNLQRINLLKKLNPWVGFSDHTLGLAAPGAAAAMGARVIEKHFTLDKNLSDFRDHQLAVNPAELAELVRRVREVETMLGEPGQEISPIEEPVVAAVRRSETDWLRHPQP